jgi:hypothetical protein
MRKTILAALSGALALVSAGTASADTRVLESGTLDERTDQLWWSIGTRSYFNWVGPASTQESFLGPGTYSFALNIDPNQVASVSTDFLALEWGIGYDSRGGSYWIETPITVPFTISQTDTGFVSSAFRLPSGWTDGRSGYVVYATVGFDVFLKDYTSPTYTITLNTLPEPETWAMMIIGLFGLGAALRARRTLRGSKVQSLSHPPFPFPPIQA